MVSLSTLPSGPLVLVLFECPKWLASFSTFSFSLLAFRIPFPTTVMSSPLSRCQLSGWHLSLQPEVARPSFLPCLNLLPLQAMDSGQTAGQALVLLCRPSHPVSSTFGGGELIHPSAKQVVLEQTAAFPSPYLAQGTIKRPVLVGFRRWHQIWSILVRDGPFGVGCSYG